MHIPIALPFITIILTMLLLVFNINFRIFHSNVHCCANYGGQLVNKKVHLKLINFFSLFQFRKNYLPQENHLHPTSIKEIKIMNALCKEKLLVKLNFGQTVLLLIRFLTH